MTSPAEYLIAEICARHLVSVEDVRGPSRAQSIFNARKAIVVALDAAGKSSVEIGRIVNRDHTSVLAMLGRTVRSQVTPRPVAPKRVCQACQGPCSKRAKRCRACNASGLATEQTITIRCLWCRERETLTTRSGRHPVTCCGRCKQLRNNWLRKCKIVGIEPNGEAVSG